MSVHNHPPYRPVCNERRVDGQLRGACLSDDGTPRPDRDALERYVKEVSELTEGMLLAWVGEDGQRVVCTIETVRAGEDGALHITATSTPSDGVALVRYVKEDDK